MTDLLALWAAEDAGRATPAQLIHSRLVTAATRYDRAQANRKGYNIYALAQYLARIDDVVAEIEAGREPADAIRSGFNDRLRDCLLAAIAA